MKRKKKEKPKMKVFGKKGGAWKERGIHKASSYRGSSVDSTQGGWDLHSNRPQGWLRPATLQLAGKNQQTDLTKDPEAQNIQPESLSAQLGCSGNNNNKKNRMLLQMRPHVTMATPDSHNKMIVKFENYDLFVLCGFNIFHTGFFLS